MMLATRHHPAWALGAVCRWGGLRIGEALRLPWARVHEEGHSGTLRVEADPTIGWEPKGHRVRSVPICRALGAILAGLRRGHMGHKCRDVVAREHNGVWGRYESRPQGLVRIMQEAANLPTGCAFHALRKTFATRAATNGVRLEVIQRWLGHASIVTTRGYIDSTLLEKEGDIEMVG